MYTQKRRLLVVPIEMILKHLIEIKVERNAKNTIRIDFFLMNKKKLPADNA